MRQPERETPREREPVREIPAPPQREIRRDPPAATASAIDAEAYVKRASQKINSGDYQGALADYSQALAIDPRNALAYHDRGVTKQDLGDYQGAITDYSQALAIDPRNALAYHGRGFAKWELGDRGGACEDYAMAIRLGSKDTKPCQ